MKIMIGVNTLTSIEQPVYANHCQFWFHLGRSMSSHQFIFNTPRRMSIDRMRNHTAKIALEMECDYILFIDDDVVVPIDCLQRLINCDADIAAGWTIIRGHPFPNMFMRFTDETKNVLEHCKDGTFDDNAVVPVDAVGFSCALLKCSLLKKVPMPWFVTGAQNTEDVYFCVKASHFLPETKIVVDTRIKTAHALGTEFIDPTTKKAYRTFFEECYPEGIINAETYEKDPDEIGDRGDKYLKTIEETLHVVKEA